MRNLFTGEELNTDSEKTWRRAELILFLLINLSVSYETSPLLRRICFIMLKLTGNNECIINSWIILFYAAICYWNGCFKVSCSIRSVRDVLRKMEKSCLLFNLWIQRSNKLIFRKKNFTLICNSSYYRKTYLWFQISNIILNTFNVYSHTKW